MTSPTAVRPCSDADRAARDSPVGSAPAFHAFVLLDYRAPWTGTAADDSVRDLLSAPAQRVIRDSTGLRAFATRPVRERRRTPTEPLRAGRTGHDAFLLRLPPDADGEVLGRVAAGVTGTAGETPSGASAPAQDIVIGVCTNAKRDRCCAVRGRPVAEALHSRFGACITEISHLGGHRFAATMLVLPTGYAYGVLAPDSAREIVRAALDGMVHPAHLRGRADLSPAAQAADAFWRSGMGPAAVDDVRIEKESPVGDGVRVSATVQGGGDEVLVRYEPGIVIDATACGGKPIRTGRWRVTSA